MEYTDLSITSELRRFHGAPCILTDIAS